MTVEHSKDNISAVKQNDDLIKKYRDFIKLLVSKTAGGPPYEQLVDAIENGTLNNDALCCLLSGFKFDSYTTQPNLHEF